MSYPPPLERRRALTEEDLAKALCATAPHSHDPPCDYYRWRAREVVEWLRREGIIV